MKSDDDNSDTDGNDNAQESHPLIADASSSCPQAPSSLENNVIGVGHWRSCIHPTLQSSLQYFPHFLISTKYDSWWKIALAQLLLLIPGPAGTGVIKKKIPGVGYLYFPSNDSSQSSAATTDTSAILWMHGGGRIVGSSGNIAQSVICSKLVQLLGTPVLSASYRLAPTNPFPAALDDLIDAYQWLVDHLQKEGLAKNNNHNVRIAVAGESAGGGLAAELCQRLLDESRCNNEKRRGALPMPVAQILLYPMLDDRTCIDLELMHAPLHLIWNNSSNMYAWSNYLGPQFRPGDERLPKYASAARRVDLTDLPPAFIICGDLDLFRGECQAYADRLKEVGVDAEYTEVKGAYHCYLSLSGMTKILFGGVESTLVSEGWEKLSLFAKKYLFANKTVQNDID